MSGEEVRIGTSGRRRGGGGGSGRGGGHMRDRRGSIALQDITELQILDTHQKIWAGDYGTLQFTSANTITSPLPDGTIIYVSIKNVNKMAHI